MKHIADSLVQVGNLVLEEWGMMMVDAAPNELTIFELDKPFYVTTASFTGVFEGEITVVCQSPFLDCLTRNVLAMPPDELLEESAKQDSIRELANLISGNFLVETYGPETTFELPQFSSHMATPEEIAQFKADAKVCCSGDGFPVMMGCTIHG